MAEAKITLAVSPHEFDLIREVMADECSRCFAVANDTAEAAATRHDHRGRAAELQLLLERLR